MPEVKKVSIGTVDNYPKARPLSVAPKKTVKQTPQQTVRRQPPQDSFETTIYDKDVADMNRLRQAARNSHGPKPAPEYPIARKTVAPAAPPAKRPVSQAPPRNRPTSKGGAGNVDSTPNYPTSGNSGAAVELKGVKHKYPEACAAQAEAHRRMLAGDEARLKPKYPEACAVQAEAYRRIRAEDEARLAQSKPLTVEPKKSNISDVQAAAHKKMLASDKAGLAQSKPVTVKPKKSNISDVQAAAHNKMLAADKAGLAQSKPVKKQVSVKPKSTKLGLAGGVTIAGGAVTLKNGVQNLANGNYKEGALQVSQGGVAMADGANDLNSARRGLSAASPTKLTKGLKVGGALLNGAGAALDGTQAVKAYRAGNEVVAAEKAGSAVINAVSAFPPTAIVGAIGGVADWAMQVSGADDAMIRGLTKKGDEAYAKQVQKDLGLAKTLCGTSTDRLARCTREEKQQYIRGLNGLKEYRQHFAAQGDVKKVRLVDAQIARIKGAWQ